MIEVDEGTVVSLCDRSRIMVQPWVEAGYAAVCVDLSFPPGETFIEGVRCIGADVLSWTGLRGRPRGVFAFPPCTDLANVGAASWAMKGLAGLERGLAVADACLRVCIFSRACFWLIENPVGRLGHYWGPPDYVFDPCDFGGYLLPHGDAYTKRTCLWTGGMFNMPQLRPVDPVEGSLVGTVANVERRSETPRGFARAVFEALSAAESFPARLPFPSIEPLRPRHSLRPGHPLQPAKVLPCPWCGREFTRGRADQKWCSARCRIAAFRSRSGVRPLQFVKHSV